MKILKILSVLFVVSMLFSCDKEKDIDTEKPNIDISFSDAFPQNCDTLYFDEAFEFKVIFTDNFELGSFSLSIHNNFDHHSHSTEVTECTRSTEKEPVNPFYFIQDYSIPDGLKEYKTNMSILIPANNASGLFDEGDYHFFIRLTDETGWSSQKGLSIKMFHR